MVTLYDSKDRDDFLNKLKSRTDSYSNRNIPVLMTREESVDVLGVVERMN